MDWSVASVHEKTIDLDLVFTNPTGVSFSRNAKDTLNFTMLKPELYASEISGKTLDIDLSSIPEIFIPQQIDPESA